MKHGVCILLSVLCLCSGLVVQAANDRMEQLVQFSPVIKTSYNVTLQEASNIYLSNLDATDSGVIYMEYEVASVAKDLSAKAGLVASGYALTAPEQYYRKGDGVRRYRDFTEGTGNPLLVSGARYYICMAETEQGIDILVQRTQNGKSVNIPFATIEGEKVAPFQYYGLYIGSSSSQTVSCELKNFRCYDGKGTELGIRLNSANSATGKIATVGEAPDYSICDGIYLCKEKSELGIIVLEANNKGYRKTDDKIEQFSYSVAANGEDKATLSLKFSKGKENYKYQYILIEDDEGNIYRRVNNPTVTFVIDEEATVVKATLENGYHVGQPEDPTKEGFTFDGWYLGNDEPHDFDQIVTESVTVYARWKEGHGNTYVPVGQSVEEQQDPMAVVFIIGSIVILAGSIVGSILILRRKGNGKRV